MKNYILALLLTLSSNQLIAHCQIPCGIYHDEVVVKGMKEDIETLAKSVKEIRSNSKSSPLEHNQMIRWVMNKEKHADKLSNTLVEYFLKQRIKPEDDKRVEKVLVIHNMLVLTMKVKQSVDLDLVEKLDKELDRFVSLMYPEMAHSHDEDHEHSHYHH